ncbi:MAG TPA: phosphotransferase [Nocardioidaceae bacterium]
MNVEKGAPNVERWATREFLAEVAAWVGDAADAAGFGLTGRWDQPHVRAWSSAVWFEARPGNLWFKVNGDGTRHEGPLVTALASLEPDLVPRVVAVDPARAWSLTEDVAPVMRAVASPDRLGVPWQTVVGRYAEAQVRLSAHGEEILSTGLPEVSPRTLPGQLRMLVDELSHLGHEHGGLTAEEAGRLTALEEQYDAWCLELAGSGIPSSVQHDDLHSSNVGWCGGAAAARIIDWGDAVWGFPLTTMLATMNSVAWHLRCEVDDPRVLAVRDAYLERFTAYADRDALVHLVGLARRTGCVGKALSYRAALADEPVHTHRELDFPVRDWLLETLAG